MDFSFLSETSKKGVSIYVSSELVSSLQIPEILFRDYLANFVCETSFYITAVENPNKPFMLFFLQTRHSRIYLSCTSSLYGLNYISWWNSTKNKISITEEGI